MIYRIFDGFNMKWSIKIFIFKPKLSFLMENDNNKHKDEFPDF